MPSESEFIANKRTKGLDLLDNSVTEMDSPTAPSGPSREKAGSCELVEVSTDCLEVDDGEDWWREVETLSSNALLETKTGNILEEVVLELLEVVGVDEDLVQGDEVHDKLAIVDEEHHGLVEDKFTSFC